MAQSRSPQPFVLAACGLFIMAYPGLALSYTTPAPYELEVMRWVGLALVGLAITRPWALATGGDPAKRMRRWTSTSAGLGVLYVVVTNPVFLIGGFATLVAAVLDAGVERATQAAHDLLIRLTEERSAG